MPLFTTIVTRIDRLRSVEFSLIANCWRHQNDEFNSVEYQIEDLAMVRFKILYKGKSDAIEVKVSSKKIKGDGPLALNIACWQTDKPTQKNSQELIIERDWLEFKNIGQFSSDVICNDVLLFAITLSINVHEMKQPMPSEKFYEDTHFTDFKLTGSDGSSVAMHRLILASHSDMFKTMLMKEWKETKEKGVEINGADLETLQHLKEYMYLGTVPANGLLPLLLLAKCYMIEKLKTECIKKLAETVRPENLYALLEFACENMMPELTFAILQFTPEDVVQSASKSKKFAVSLSLPADK